MAISKEEKQVIELATLAGKILLESEAEGYRVERTVLEILDTCQLDHSDVFSNASGLFVTLQLENQLETPNNQAPAPGKSPGITIVTRILHRINRIDNIHQVNLIVNRYLNREISSQEAYKSLTRLPESEFTAHHTFTATILLVMSFVILLGGGLTEVILSLIPATVILFFALTTDNFGLNQFALGVLMTAIVSFTLSLVNQYVTYDFNTGVVMAATLMPLYPGTAFTNAIRDLLRGDYSSGITRLVDALITALSLALGIGLGLSFVNGVNLLWK